MAPVPQTIQIFLPHGDPRGIRIAEITTRTVQVIEVPRSLLSDFLKMPESNQVAIYFLVGSDEEEATPEVYVGQTGDLRHRLASHNKSKDFWQRALVVISRTNSLTQTHAVFLEWHCIQAIRQVARFADKNNTKGTCPHTPAPLEAECLELYETATTLIATLGYPFFSALSSTDKREEKTGLFHCRRGGADGKGLYTAEGFIVLEGSTARLEALNSAPGTWIEKLRTQLLTDGVLVAKGESYLFTCDYQFKSPSAAAVAVIGGAANGWTEWKTQDGRTLDDVYRQSPTDVDET